MINPRSVAGAVPSGAANRTRPALARATSAPRTTWVCPGRRWRRVIGVSEATVSLRPARAGARAGQQGG
ncbi:MAG: hypothetical protein R3E68_12175 [Burkholderiaceae bacterium]